MLAMALQLQFMLQH